MQIKPAIDFSTALLYAVAAVSGGLGGCTAAAYYFTHNSQPRLPFILAYCMFGVGFGVISLAASFAFNRAPESIDLLILTSMLSGSAGALALASANFTAKILLRRLGVEIQLTMRPPNTERRCKTGEE